MMLLLVGCPSLKKTIMTEPIKAYKTANNGMPTDPASRSAPPMNAARCLPRLAALEREHFTQVDILPLLGMVQRYASPLRALYDAQGYGRSHISSTISCIRCAFGCRYRVFVLTLACPKIVANVAISPWFFPGSASQSYAAKCEGSR
jgi:hypothetical protein